MATVSVDVRHAAIQLSPSRRPTLNLRKRELAVERLSQCSNLSWCTGETLSSVPHAAGSCVGALLLVFFIRCLFLKWRKYKGTHPVASRYAFHGAAACDRVASRVSKVYRKKRRSLERKYFRMKLWCIIYYYLATRAWVKCRYKVVNRVSCLVDRLKTAYLGMAIRVYCYAPIIKVSALVIFLYLILSGDIELNPGPKHGCLTLRDLGLVQASLWDARSKWYNIGIQLDMKASDLDSIRLQNMGNPDECITQLLKTWLRQRRPPPTWNAIINALRSPTVGLPNKADKMENGDSDSDDDSIKAAADKKGRDVCPADEKTFQDIRKIEGVSREKLESKLEFDSENIQLEYEAFCNKFFDSLKRVSVKRLVEYLEGLKVLKKSSPKNFENISNFNDIKRVIKEHSTFFDYRPVEYMIKSVGLESVKKELEEYKDKLELYFTEWTFKCPIDIGPSDTPNSSELLVKVEHDYSKLVELKQFQCQLSVILDVSVHVLRLASVAEGCIQMLFVVPNIVRNAIFPLTAEQEQDLREIGVIKLLCGDCQFSSESQEPSDDDDSHFDDPSSSGTGRDVRQDTQSVELSLDTFEEIDESYTSDNASLLLKAAHTGDMDDVVRLVEEKKHNPYQKAPLIERKMNAYRQAIKDKGSIDQIIMQGIFFGLPQSGKTSSRKRLLGMKPSRHQASTVVVERVSHVGIEQKTIHVSKYSWSEVSEVNDETALLVDDIVEHKLGSTHKKYDSSFVQSEAKEGFTTRQRKPSDRRVFKIRTIVNKVKSILFGTRRHTARPPPSSDQSRYSVLSKAVLTSLSSTVQKQSSSTRQERQGQWTIYLSDVGGQPEFQELLPALVSGPSLYFLTFPLHKGLKERFKVEYQHPNGKSIIPFEMTSTMEEVLLQSLAMIASTKSHTRLDGKAVNAKVLFIATHKDKILSEQQLLEIDQQLQKTIEKTTAYTENMIVFQSKHQMVFAVDNTSSDESDIQQVRDAVERIGTSTDEYKMSLPTTWMIFAITLRHFPERVLTIEKCMEIAQECGIDSFEELNSVLYFLHHDVGVIRYFQDHPELQGFIIKEPQYIFDTLTEMMGCTLNYEDLGPYHHKESIKKGIFLTSTLHKLSTESEVLTGNKFATLLEHHHILTPIEVDDNGKVVKYFAPATLAHAELPPDTQAKKIIPTLVVAFKSGFCPTGMFGSLIVQLLKDDKQSNFKWKLVQDEIYRNQISFAIGPYDSFRFSLTATCIQVDCISSLNVDDRVPLGEVCCDIRDCIINGVQLITQKLNYNEKASCYLAFNCPEHEQSASCHLATINFHKGKACSLTCTDINYVYPLHENHKMWFDEEMTLPSSSAAAAAAAAALPPPAAGDIPTISELLSFKRSNGTSVNIAVEVSTGYSKFAAQLLNDDTGARLRNIAHSKRENPEEINIEILREWLKGGERRPVTWAALARVLEDIDKGELAAQIKQVKSLN